MLLFPKIVNCCEDNRNIIMPVAKTQESACADLCARLHQKTVKGYNPENDEITLSVFEKDRTKAVLIYPGERVFIPTGIKMIIPHGYFARIVPRSGISIKQGLILLNTPGTIDSDYPGEVMVLMMNATDIPMPIKDNQAICQFDIQPNTMKNIHFKEGTEEELREHIEHSDRTGGFGSTG